MQSSSTGISDSLEHSYGDEMNTHDYSNPVPFTVYLQMDAEQRNRHTRQPGTQL
jgi:hypothetical protein